MCPKCRRALLMQKGSACRRGPNVCVHVRGCVRGCVCVCRCLSVCVCVQVTQSLAKARTTVNKHAEIETTTWPAQRSGSGHHPPAPLPLFQPSLSLSFCAAGQLWRLSTLPTACQPTLLCFRMSCTRTSLALSLSLCHVLSLSPSACLSLCACVLHALRR